MKWKDITSYSRGEARIPCSFEMRVGELRLVVTRRHGCEGWYADLGGALWDYRSLRSVDIEDAKNEAIAKTREFLVNALEALPAVGAKEK
jgi:hypothetical protein